MINNKFCAFYKYKGSSTNFYWEGHNRFFQNEDDLGRWLVKTDKEGDSFMDVVVYSVDIKIMSYNESHRIMINHTDNESLKARDNVIKKQKAIDKLSGSGLSLEDIKVLKDAKII